MDVSKVAPPPIAVVVPNYDQTKPQDDQATKAKDAETAYQPPPAPPLPPGQGTRIDQLA
jgi:hypothetical protein